MSNKPAKPSGPTLAELIYAQAVAAQVARSAETGAVLTTKFLSEAAELSRDAAEQFKEAPCPNPT